MKIGIFIDTYSPQINGVVTSTKMLKTQLEKLGHTVYIITVTLPQAKEQTEDVMRVGSIPFPPLPEHRIALPYSQQLMDKVKELDLDLIHTQTEFSVGIFGRIAAKKLDLPVVHTYHTMYEDYVHYIVPRRLKTIHSYASKLARKLSKLYSKDCDTVIAPTEKAKTALESYGVRTNIEVVPTGIDLEPFRKENYKAQNLRKLRTELGIEEEDPVILFVGRLAQEKSIDVVIEAMPELLTKLPEAKFLIVGGGPERKALEELGAELGISSSLVFAGEQPWEEIGKYYQIGDAFVSASTTETQGLTFVEAMASETPVVAKYDKNLEDMLTDGVNGLIFNKDDELPETLFKVLTEEEQTEQMVKQAYQDAQVMSAENFGKQIEEAYLSILRED